MSAALARRTALLAALLLCASVQRVSARSAAARASASGAGGGGANSGVVSLTSTAVPGPLPPALQAAARVVFANATATLAGTPLVCGSIGSLQSGYTRTAAARGPALLTVRPPSPPLVPVRSLLQRRACAPLAALVRSSCALGTFAPARQP